MIKWEHTNKRFIGFMDIMGFKNTVYSNSHDSMIEIMESFHKEVQEHENFIADIGKKHNKESIIKTTIFSDSIVVFSMDDSVKSLEALTAYCISLFVGCMKQNIPIKGAISHGLITANFEKSLFFGKALIEAYLLGEECFMYGIIADHKVENFINSHKPHFGSQYILGKVPMKKGYIQHMAVNWLLHVFPKDSRMEKIKNFYTTVSGTPRKYVDNTVDFADQYLN